MQQMIEAVEHTQEINRRACRLNAEQRFSSEEMVEKHLSIIHTLVAEKHTARLNKPSR